jgi:hypothetical protein
MKFKDFLRNSLFLRISLTSYVLEYYVFKICKVVSRPWPSLLGLKEMSVGGQVKKDRKAGPRKGERKVEEKNNLKG